MNKKKVVFFFAGTGRYCDEYRKEHEYLDFGDDVVRIYVSGCQDRAVGGGVRAFIWPSLSIAARHVDKAFKEQNGALFLDLEQLKENFGNRIIVEPQDLVQIDVESLALEGYSRGAVTTFVVAQKLDEKCFRTGVPLDLIPNQAVTGESEQYNRLFQKYHDLRSYKSLRSVSSLYAMHDKDNGLLHSYFVAMKPETASTTETTHILLPQQKHNRSTTLNPADSKEIIRQRKLIETPAPYHIATALSKYHYAEIKSVEIKKMEDRLKRQQKNSILPSIEAHANAIEKALYCSQAWYLTHQYYFTPHQFSQKIYGTQGDYRKELTESADYLKIQIKKAQALLNPHCLSCTDATKATALLSVDETIDDAALKQELFTYILSPDPKATLLCEAINNITNSCSHLHDRIEMKKFSTNKRAGIQEQGRVYKQEVFAACFAHIKDPNLQALSEALEKAEKKFADTVLSEDRYISSKYLRVIGQYLLELMAQIIPCFYNATKASNADDTEQFKKKKTAVLAVKSEKLIRDTTEHLVESLSLVKK